MKTMDCYSENRNDMQTICKLASSIGLWYHFIIVTIEITEITAVQTDVSERCNITVVMSRIRLESVIGNFASGEITNERHVARKTSGFAQKLMNVPSEMREKF